MRTPLTARSRPLGLSILAALAVGWVGIGVVPAAAADAPAKKPTTVEKQRVDSSVLERERAAELTADPAADRTFTALRGQIEATVKDQGAKYDYAAYVDATTGKVVLQTDAPQDQIDKLTAAAKGFSLAAEHTTGEASGAEIAVNRTTVEDSWNRRDDTTPYWGGNGLSASGYLCSSGYPVKSSSGYRYMVTAGHCWPNGTKVRTESGARTVGWVTGRALASQGGGPRDMELLYGSSYAGRVFSGGVYSTSSRKIVGAGQAFAGYTDYCHSGRTTGEHCGHTAVSTNAMVCTSSGCKWPVTAFTGGTMIQGGDSGGAFYARSGDSLWIRGHVIAHGGGTGYAEQYPKVASRYGVSIATD
ncbi:MAG: hypothetical protein ACK5MT_05850 [Actinomycetales bacterium]